MNQQDLDQLIAEAKNAYKLGDYTTAISIFQQARESCLASGDELQAAEMANNLSVTHLQAKQPHKALECALGTDQVFASFQDIAKQGMALGNIGTAYEDLGNLDQAVIHYKQSIELLEQAGETEYRGMVQKSLAAIQIRKGEHLGGIITMKQSLEDKKELSPRERWLKRLLKLPFKFF